MGLKGKPICPTTTIRTNIRHYYLQHISEMSLLIGFLLFFSMISVHSAALPGFPVTASPWPPQNKPFLTRIENEVETLVLFALSVLSVITLGINVVKPEVPGDRDVPVCQ